MHVRLFVWTSGSIAVLQVALCLIQLSREKWPVVLSYARWEYALRVLFGTLWAIWAGLILWVPR